MKRREFHRALLGLPLAAAIPGFGLDTALAGRKSLRENYSQPVLSKLVFCGGSTHPSATTLHGSANLHFVRVCASMQRWC
jgi:hypothetical protein